LFKVEQLYEITESKFAETYPGKCAFIGQQKERPMFVFGNKEEYAGKKFLFVCLLFCW
jgi:hypothetical protein